MEPDGFPMLQVEKLTFSDGTTLNIRDDDVILLVGPNNSGKSACLRELRDLILHGPRAGGRKVLKSADIKSPQTQLEIKEWLDQNVKRDREGTRRLPYVGRLSDVNFERDWELKSSVGLRDIGRLLTRHLTTEERLSAASPVNSIDFADEVETHPLHRLFIDEEFERQVDEYFESSFGNHLIVNRGAGPKIKLHVGDEVPSENKMKWRDYLEMVSALPALHEQGDGMRSFVGVLISILASRRRVILLDEPEAFLHPPQAASLGKLLAHHLPKGRQLIVATHSTDFVKGVLDDVSSQVRVIRLKRERNINRVHELDPANVRLIWSDPLLRYSGVLDGLFHDGVVVCEGDTDCRFYSAIAAAMKSNGSHQDIVFVHGGGKDRIAAITRSLRAVGVPVKAIADFDILADLSAMKKVVEAFGGDWDQLEPDWKVTKDAVDRVRAQKSLDDIRGEIDEVFASARGYNLSEDAIDRIRKIIRQGSGWAEAKRVGKAYIPAGQQYNTYCRLEKSMQEIGLFVVPVGEVEGFCRAEAGKGPKWALKALERDILQDNDLAEARSFCKNIVDDWP